MEQLKLKRVTRIDSIPAGSTYFNEQGFLHDTPIVTSTGIFEYALPDGGVRRELRLPEHVFDKESLASYVGKPVIITHNAGSIDKNNVMKEIVGTILSEGYQDGNDVRCKIVIHDIDKVKKMPYRELSLGYSLDLIEEPGEWNGEHYDAIQTNIRINHLAIVESARAGDQAHLNLDGKKIELDDIDKTQEGGNKSMQNGIIHADSIDMTPEELIEAIKSYKASKTGTPAEGTAPAEPKAEENDAENIAAEGQGAGTPAAQQEVPKAETQPTPPEEVKKDSNINALVKAVEELLVAIKEGTAGTNAADSAEAGCAFTGTEGTEPPIAPANGEGNDDSSDDKSQSINNDSADNIFRQRLSICRIGDKLHMDGLEEKSIEDGKKAIIAKVLPDIRLDGKSGAYIDAAYDMAVAKVNERKDCNYQRQQMTSTPPEKRMDGNENVSMASSARQRMLEREGGNE